MVIPFLLPFLHPHLPECLSRFRQDSHDCTALGFVLAEVRRHGSQVRPAGRHVRDALGRARGFTAFDSFVVLVDASERGHVENVPHAVLRLQR